jgi:hypothetical protein
MKICPEALPPCEAPGTGGELWGESAETEAGTDVCVGEGEPARGSALRIGPAILGGRISANADNTAIVPTLHNQKIHQSYLPRR